MKTSLFKVFALTTVLALMLATLPMHRAQAASPSVFINEIHYDNASTDVGEAIEIAGLAGTDLTGWSLVRYNGSNGQVYTTPAADPAGSDVLSGTIPDLGSGYGVMIVNYLVNGLQNGAPDGIALVDAGSNVIQFLSYEGTFVAVGGPADGMLSTDIGVSESGSGAVGDSLQLTGTGTTYDDFTWTADAPNTFGAFNTGQTFAPSPFINEIHYDNTGTDSGEAIEIAGPAGTDLTGWSLIRYNGANGQVYTTPAADPAGSDVLSGTIPDLGGGYGVVVVDYLANGLQNGAPDGIALVDAGSNVIQFLSYEGTFTATNGPASGMTSADIGVSEDGSGAVGDSLQLTGTGTTYDDFTWAADAPNTFGAFNAGQTFGSGPTNPSGTGAADPSILFAGDSTLLTLAVTPGANPTSTELAVSCDLTAIGGAADQAFYDDGTNGDLTAADNTFSYSVVVAGDTTGGDKSLPCTITDAQARSGSATISLTVTVILPIGTVNGPVGDTDNGTAHVSPYVGQTVLIQGVIYEKTLQATSFGGTYNGFFIQNTAATADSDPDTSDGLFVFMSTFTSLIGGYTPVVGDEVVISGTVSEYFNMTELSSAKLVKSVSSNNPLPAPVVANPPVSLADANRYWERLQGMRVEAPSGSIVLGGRNVFNPADAEVWVARSDSTIGLRTDPFTNRAFRDAHPLDDNYDPNSWDGNGYRILLGSLGIKAAIGNNKDTLIAPAQTFDTLAAAVSGGLNYTFSKYRIEITEQPTFEEGPDPATNHAPQAPDRSTEYSIADYNVENLYDYRNNPFSGCDFAGDTGCPAADPFLSAVSPPYDYVPADDAAYQARITDIATQIIDVLHSPDILMMQEVENQDICSVSGGSLVCGTTDNADGQPDDLQDLALKIAELGGPTYAAAFDRDSSDLRGILPAFMYRTDRVELVSPVGDPILGANPVIGDFTAVPYDADVSNPKTFNAELPAGIPPTAACETKWVFPRAPDIGLFRIYTNLVGDQTYRDVYVIDNHFKSNPDACQPNRTEQANYNAALVAYLQATNPAANIVLGGDLNVYARPDDTTPTSDQLAALYGSSLGLTNMYDVELDNAPEAAYSYVYLGMAQTIDQIFLNQPMLDHLVDVRTAHINSDFPADYPDDIARGTSDHDPTVARFLFNLPPVANPDSFTVKKNDSGVVYALDNDSDPEGDTFTVLSYTQGAHGTVKYSLKNDNFRYTPKKGFSGTDTFTYTIIDAFGGTATATVTVTVK